MSLIEMQAALARLYVDGPLLDRFCTDHAEVLGRYDLTPREAQALAGIDREALRRFAGSLRAKTWGRFKVPYRLLRALDEPVVYKHYLRFYELRPIRPNERFYGPTLELGEFFERAFRGLPELPPYASELARYERLFFQARFQPERGPRAAEAPDTPSPVSRLHVLPGVRVARFGYDMRAIDRALSAGGAPEGIVPTDCHVLYQSFEQLGRARKLRISASTADLVALSDGERDLAAAAKALAADVGAVVEAARKLVELGVAAEAGPR